MNIIPTGVKGSSKSTIEKLLTGDNIDFNKIISYTTKNPRAGEIDGVDYHFVSDSDFNDMIFHDQFAEIVEYGDFRYGITKEDLLNNKDNVAVVEINGLKQILNTIPHNELFIVKLDCDVNEQVRRIIERDKLDDYDDIIKLMKTLKSDREYFSQPYDYDYYLNTTNLTIDEVLSNVLIAYGEFISDVKRNPEVNGMRCNLA